MEMNSAPLGEVIDYLYTLRASRLDLEREADKIKKQESEIKTVIIDRLTTQELKAGRGEVATAAITYKTTANVTDWDQVYDYIKKTNMFELLHRRITTTLWATLEEEGQHVPGTESLVIADLSLNKAAQS